LIYEDPNSMGPKDRYILVWVNMFDNRGINPTLIQKYIEETLKVWDNVQILENLLDKGGRRGRSKSPKFSV